MAVSLQDTEGLSSTSFANKLKHLATERKKLETKYKNFSETREKLAKQIDDAAKERLNVGPVYATIQKS